MIGWFVLNTFVGSRPSETIKMKWNDINLKNGEIYIQPDSKTGCRRPLLDEDLLSWFKNLYEQKPENELIPKNIDKKNVFKETIKTKSRNQLDTRWASTYKCYVLLCKT